MVEKFSENERKIPSFLKSTSCKQCGFEPKLKLFLSRNQKKEKKYTCKLK